MAAEGPGKVRFASYVFDRVTGELTREGIRLRLEKQPARVLELLIAANGSLVTREQLIAALWPDEVSGEFDRRLHKALTKLRAALNDSPHAPAFVETLKGRGYRFIAETLPEPSPVEPTQKTGEAVSDAVPPAVLNAVAEAHAGLPSARVGLLGLANIFLRGPFGVLGLCMVSILIAGIVAVYSRLFTDPPQVIEYTQMTHDGWRKNLVGVDGKRLYIVEANDLRTIQAVSLADGSTIRIPLALPQAVILDFARDGSAFLVASAQEGHPGLWSLRVADGTLTCLVPGIAVTAAAWSPDGKTILLANADGRFFSVQEDGKELHALAAAGGQQVSGRIEDLRWSPDGTKLRFTRRHALWEMNPDGSALHQALWNWMPNSWNCCGQWSGDGTLYAFSARDSLFSSSLLSDSLWAFDMRGPLEKLMRPYPIRLTTGPMRWSSAIPSWEGSVIYARGISLRGEMVRSVPRSGNLEPFLGGISAEYLAYSPDGRFICFVSFPEGTLWKAWRDGSHAIELLGEPFYPIAPHWSPDGSTIAFDNTDASGIPHSWAIAVSGGRPYRLFPEEQDAQTDPVWSPDGSQIVYAGRRREGSTSLTTFRLYNRARRTTARLPGSENMSSPRWSPDGRSLVGIDERTRGLRRFDFDTQTWTSLEGEQAEFPSISRDGRWVYFLRPFESPGVERVPLAGGKVERVVDLTGVPLTGYYSYWFGLDDQDTPLLLRDTGLDDIYALHLR